LITHSNNINHDPITKSGFTVQPQQKIGLFHNVHMFSDIVMLMKIPPKSINTDYISSFKKVSIMFASGKSGNNN